MINEFQLMAAQKAFMKAPKQMNGATLCAFFAATALDFARDNKAEAKNILEASKTMVDLLELLGKEA